ncbi:MAG: hypothetical protein FWE80_08300 [Oscillospiraceae bacterium]|nr:hypothetical protein [Oscillospiraceae bacterium]
MENNKVLIDMQVRKLTLSKDIHGESIPTGNRKYIYLRFEFTREWNKLNKWAILSKDGVKTETPPIIKNICQIPAAFMTDPGVMTVSVAAGDRMTVNAVDIAITLSGYLEGEPPDPDDPTSVYVQSPGASITAIRENNGDFEYLAGGAYKKLEPPEATINGVKVEGDKSLADFGIHEMSAAHITKLWEGKIHA